MGEGKLESYLEEHPPIESNVNHAKIGLIEAKRCLQQVIGEDGIRVNNSIFWEEVIRLLLHFFRLECLWMHIYC